MPGCKIEPFKSAVVHLTELDVFPTYVAIYSSSIAENRFIFSPAAMQWNDQIVLNCLECCQSFWLSQMDKMQCDLETLLTDILNHYFDHDFIAVFACHPWQCLMYLSYQRHQNSSGVYFLQNRLNKNIFQTLGWQFWFEPQADYVCHLESIRIKGFNSSGMRRFQGRLQRFIHRVGINGPFELNRVDYQSFSRRFGEWLGRLLRWTVNDTEDLCGFPWIAIKYSEQPTVSRDLEYPVNIWEVVEGLLIEDFTKLAEGKCCGDHEHINRINWQIRLFNQEQIEVEINFRFPYSLQQDQPGFKTVLYQARYVYQDLMAKLQSRDDDLDLPEMMPLLGWKIEICERFVLPPLIWDLFSDGNDIISDQAVNNLQNKLPVELESFDLSRGFNPEQSFIKKSINHNQNRQGCDLQWLQQSLFRPLFYYPEAELIEYPQHGLSIFLERSMCQWWEQQSCVALHRDYFLLKSMDGRMSWVYRDYDGAWFKQGEYS